MAFTRRAFSRFRRLLTIRPAARVIATQHTSQGIQQQVRIHRLTEHAEDSHPKRLAQQMARQIICQQNRRRGLLMKLMQQPNDLKAAQLRHLMIQHRCMKRPRLKKLQRFPPGACRDGLHTLRLEETSDGLVPPLLLVGEQNGEPMLPV